MRRLRLVPDNTKVPFFRYRWIAFAWSLFVLLATVVLVATSGLNLGIDFRGGVLLEVRSQGPADLALMRSTLGELDLGDVSLQTAGSDDQVMIRAKAPEGDEAAQRQTVERIKTALDHVLPGLSYQRAEFVGVHRTVRRDRSNDGFTVGCIVDAEDRAVVDGRMSVQHGLDLGGRHLESPDLDHFLGPVGDV